MNEPKPIRPPCDDAERRRKALEQLRRSKRAADDLHRRIGSMLRQVEELIDMEERKDQQAA